jgi:hypothetical protein
VIDRPIDVISIASLIILVTSRLADQRTKALDWRCWAVVVLGR